MSHFAGLISPATLHALGWALVHFLWEGLALAALFAAGSAFLRSASARYLLGVAVLAAMLVAPLIAFTQLLPGADNPAAGSVAGASVFEAVSQSSPASLAIPRNSQLSRAPIRQSGALLWFVEAWFAGVVLLSLRAAGGFFFIARMRRRESKPVTAVLLEKCLALQRRLRLGRMIRYCECRRLGAPAVIGWFRPVILLPLSVLTGLSDDQLEAVIAHELAHIRRFDSFVNLFQIAVETLLFYHPAVWWVSKRTRDDRENCCDDVAISVCGDAVGYARALTLMEEWRSVPSFAMAANRGPLAARVARLLGMTNFSSGARTAGFAASFFCLAGALVAGNAFVSVAQNFFGYDGVPASAHLSDAPAKTAVHSAISTTISSAIHQVTSATLNAVTGGVSPSPRQASNAAPQSASSQSSAPSSGGSFIEGMKSAGLDNLTVEQLIAFKTQGVTPEYVKAIHDLGLHPSVEELIGMKVQGVSPEYIQQMKAAGADANVQQLIAMKVQGVSPEYVKAVHDLGLHPATEELIGMRVQGVSPEYIQQMKAAGADANVQQLIAMKVQGVSPEYVKAIHDLGLHQSVDELIGMKVQGVSPDYIQQMKAAGVDVKMDQLIGMRVQGVTPEYVKQMKDLGIQLGSDELIGMKVQGLSPEYVQALKKTGLPDFKDDPASYIAAKVNGITPEFVQSVQSHGFKDLDLEKLIALKRSGIF